MSESEHEVESVRKRNKKKKKKLRVEMSVLSSVPDRISPMVGYFSSGYNPDEATDHEIKVFGDRRHRSSRLDLVVKPSGESKVEFVGTSYTEANAQHNPCNYALGVLDKDSGTLKIVPIAGNKIFRLEPKVIKNSSDVEPSEGLVVEERKLADLTSLYGTKRQKNMDKRRRSLMEQTEDPSAREHLNDLMHDTDDRDNEALKDANVTTDHNIPPHDPAAVTPETAYLLDEIILKSERNDLYDILTLLQSPMGGKTTFWEENYYPSFVINRLHKLRQFKVEEEKKKYACILTYITHLVNFWKLTGAGAGGYSKSSRSISNLFGEALNKYKIPKFTYQKFMKIFVDREADVIPTEKKELMIGYILVLTLFADSFRTDSSDITKDLSKPDLNLYYLQLGCKSEKGFFILCAPLNIRPITKRRKRQQY